MSTGEVSRERYPTISADSVGWLTEDEMVEVDRVMIEELGIELIQMMENAGRNLARLVLDLASPSSATVYAGTGGNGGGGLVAARHLANAGVDVMVALTRPPDELTGVTRHQLNILDAMSVPVDKVPRPRADVAVDALLGYSLRGAPRGLTAQRINEIAGGADGVVALDTPSGLDVTTGDTPGAAVEADVTLTLALPKVGLRHSPLVGELYLADISVPPGVLHALGAKPPDLSRSSILHIGQERHVVSDQGTS